MLEIKNNSLVLSDYRDILLAPDGAGSWRVTDLGGSRQTAAEQIFRARRDALNIDRQRRFLAGGENWVCGSLNV